MTLTHIEWIRIWGLNWDERYSTEVREGSKNLRSSVPPIADVEIAIVKSFLEKCKIPDDSENFLLVKNLQTNEWSGKVLNNHEPEEYDNG